MEQHTCRIDDLGPLPLHQPTTVAEVSDLVRRAAAAGQAVYPVGGRTMLDLGLPPTKPGLVIDLTALDQVIDYPARDMTITVQAGITLSKLQALLAAENQRLPIDVPHPDQATLGGAIATNASGPQRYGFGTLRDYLIGITVVNDEGQEVKAGGRVVKNVAGYDLCKLYTGSLGTLGIITQVTLKVRPRPEAATVCYVSGQGARVETWLERLHGSRTRPVCIELLNPATAERTLDCPPDQWLLFIGLEGNEQAVAWQSQQLHTELGIGGTETLRPYPGKPEAIYQKLTEFQLRPTARLTFKANLLAHQVAAFCRDAAALPGQPLLQAHAGNGVVLGHFEGDLTRESASTMLTLFHEVAGPEGNVLVTRCPPAWKSNLPVWGRPRGDAWLMRTVKEKLDPRRLFNPGRFIDGI